MRQTLLVLLLVGCDPIASDAPADAPADARRTVAVDGATTVIDGQPGTRTVNANCIDYTQTVTTSDQARYVTTYRFATIPEVTVGVDFTIAQCDLTIVPAPVTCSPGSTCTGTTTPSGAICDVARTTGRFYGGKLTVLCGWTQKSYDAAGVLVSTISSTYATTTVTF